MSETPEWVPPSPSDGEPDPITEKSEIAFTPDGGFRVTNEGASAKAVSARQLRQVRALAWLIGLVAMVTLFVNGKVLLGVITMLVALVIGFLVAV